MIYFLLDGLYAFPAALMASSWLTQWLLSMAHAFALCGVAAAFICVAAALCSVAAAHTSAAHCGPLWLTHKQRAFEGLVVCAI